MTMITPAEGGVLLAHHLIERSGGIGGGDSSTRPSSYRIIGIILAIASGCFIGVSFVLKKVGLLRANAKYNEEAGEGYGYLKNFYWWSGMTLMIIGELCNVVAYAFVDAILVTPLGALSVVITTILSAIFLKERLSFVGKVGCFNCIVGSIIIAINAPEQSAVTNIQDMKNHVITPWFLTYTGVVCFGCLFVALWVAPRYGKKSIFVYITICSLIGGLSVTCIQGLGAAILTQIRGTPQFNQWFIYVLLVFVIGTLLTEIIYLNKALNIFNAALVTPTYYVYFTTATIVTSAILFRGFKGSATQIATIIMGFLQICAGVVLLQLSKSSKDVPDAAVFSGDLDQVRTVAEQKEPEYEPKADAIRGGASLLRSLSVSRKKQEAEEAKKIHEEKLETIGENENVEWDGLRRRKTVVGDSFNPGSITRRKTLHPPLGMSEFPEEEEEHEDSEMHPGLMSRFRSFSRSNRSNSRPTIKAVPLEDRSQPGEAVELHGPASPRPHAFGLPEGLRQQDTSYKGANAESTGIHWSPGTENAPKSPTRPGPKSKSNKRQFSFQNMFTHAKTGTDGERPKSARSGLSFSSRKSGHSGADTNEATEEERLGLVKGDSRTFLEASARSLSPADASRGGSMRVPTQGHAGGVSPHTHTAPSGGMTPASNISPGTTPAVEHPPKLQKAAQRVDTTESSSSPTQDKDIEKQGGGDKSFL